MIRTTDLDQVATDRVNALPMAAVYQLVMLLADHLKANGHIDRDTFLMLASEAEAVASW